MEISREPHSSSDFSNFETESVHHTDKEIQADLDHTSNLEGSEYSYQGGNVEFKDMQAGIEFAVQITPIKDSKKHKEKMDAARESPGSSYFPDDMTEILDNKSQAEQMVITTQIEGNAMPPEIYPRIGEASSLERMGHLNRRQITTTDLDLEKMRLDGAMIRLKYRHEDNEKRRLHEEKMEQLRQKASSQSIGQQLHELFQPQNQYALFFFCFIFIHVIYTIRELVFYFITKHHLFCYAILLYLGFLKILMDYKQRKKQPWNSSRL